MRANQRVYVASLNFGGSRINRKAMHVVQRIQLTLSLISDLKLKTMSRVIFVLLKAKLLVEK